MMNFRNFIKIFCVLLHLTYLAGCNDTSSSPAPATSGTSNESATSPQSEQQQRQQEAFFTAVREGDMEAISNYLNNRGDVDVKDIFGHTALHHVKNIEVARSLIAAGADVNHKGGGLRTLFATISENNSDIRDVLVNEGADTIDVNDRTMVDRKTPLFFATSAEVVEKLIERGAYILAGDYRGSKPLHHARNSEVVQALIESYSLSPIPAYDLEDYVNLRTINGTTPLLKFLCQRQGKDDENIEKGVQALIEAGADVNIKSAKNDFIVALYGEGTALECAEIIGNEEVIRLLRDAGATE